MSCPGVRQVASRAALAEGRRAEEGCAIRWRGEAPQPRLECDEPADMCIAASMLEDDLGLPEDVHGRPDDLGLAKGGRRVSPAESYRLGQWSRQGAGETGEEEIEGQGRADRTSGSRGGSRDGTGKGGGNALACTCTMGLSAAEPTGASISCTYLSARAGQMSHAP